MHLGNFNALALFFAAVICLSGAGIREENVKEADQITIFNALTGETEVVARIHKTDAEWKKILTPEQFEVTRKAGTEAPFSKICPIPPKGKGGIYQCVACGTDLFKYEKKFESGTGWPSFWDPISPLNVKLEEDNTLGMRRVEVLCARCDAHLGHVFDDGPPPSGKRFCINTIAFKLAEYQEAAK